MTPFNPEDLLTVADDLIAQEGEAHARSAASRAYYGVFLIARELAEIDEGEP